MHALDDVLGRWVSASEAFANGGAPPELSAAAAAESLAGIVDVDVVMMCLSTTVWLVAA